MTMTGFTEIYSYLQVFSREETVRIILSNFPVVLVFCNYSFKPVFQIILCLLCNII